MSEPHPSFALLLALLSSCLLVSGHSSHVPIRTDQPVYKLPTADSRVPLQIVATYTNDTGRTVWLKRCGHRPPKFEIERYVEGEWIPHDPVTCALVYVPPVEVAPGEQRVDSLPPLLTTVSIGTPGIYRLVYDLFRNRDEREGGKAGHLPKEMRISNAFRVER